MSMTLLWALICLIIFIAVLAHPKLPNWMTFICLAPVALFLRDHGERRYLRSFKTAPACT